MLRPKRSSPRLAVTAAATVFAFVACDRASPPPPLTEPPPIHHDFGMIAHGEVATVRLPIAFPQDLGPIVPLGFRGSCSCAAWSFVAIGKDGRERVSYGRVDLEHAVFPGEQLLFQLSLDTNRKEALEQKPITNTGEILLVDVGEKHGRVSIPVTFTFGIDAPVKVAPFAHVDFGALPMSRRFPITLELRGKTGSNVQFLGASAADPRVAVALRQDGDATLLDIKVTPDRGLGQGTMQTTVTVRTDLPNGYQVPIPVSGQFVDDLEIKPMERIAFGRIDLAAPSEGFVILTDHDDTRPEAFTILGVRSVVGDDLAKHFEATLTPVEGTPRSARLTLRYKGTFRDGRTFRGFVEVGKAKGGGSVAKIDFVGFGND
jgi:hypothetical protein